MIYELPVALWERARPLFAAAWADRAFIAGAFEGRQGARLFVDDPLRPMAALLCRTFEFYVAGSAGATELRRFIADAPVEAGVFAEFYGYVATTIDLTAALLDDHEGRLIVVPRRNFVWRQHAQSAARLAARREPAVANVTIRLIDRALAERVDQEFRQTIGSFWGGYPNYLANGFGYCAFVGQELAAVAYAAAVSSSEANIDVFTTPQYRRQGLAACVCTAFIDHCHANGLTATWDCDSDNPPSAALARDLGFTEDQPFCQLSTPNYRPHQLSEGRWHVATRADGVGVWRSRIVG